MKKLRITPIIILILTITVFVGSYIIQKPKDVMIGEAANLPGDVDGNGTVNIIDFQLLSNTFGKSLGQTGYDSRADFNSDNVVDILDFQILSNNFGKVTSTPTPTTQALGHTYYVSKSGNDSNPGTQSSPWATIQKAADTLTAGDMVFVNSGNYSERVQISKSATSASPITFRTSGVVVMNGFTLNASYVVIDGFEITNKSLDTTQGWGIYTTGIGNVFLNNYIHDTTWGGIMLFANVASPTSSQNDTVQNNKIYHVGELGIDVRGRNHTIRDNDISAVMQYPGWLPNPPSWVDADGIHFHGSGHKIIGNYIHDISYTQSENKDPHIDCFQTFSSAPSQEPASNITFSRNICSNAQNKNTGGSYVQGKGFTIQDSTGKITIENNIIGAGTGINENTNNGGSLVVLNNTFWSITSLSDTNNLVAIALTGVPYTIENNIFYNNPGHIIYVYTQASPFVTAKNLVYRDDGQALWTTGTYNHSGDLWGVNPLIVSYANRDFHLQANSPAINSGVNDGLTTDIEGNSRPKGIGYDIGAYEY